MRNRARQSGITMIGFLFVAAVLLSVAIIGFRVLPSYIEYFSVEKILRQVLEGARDGATLNEVRRDFDRRSGATSTGSRGPITSSRCVPATSN